MGWLRFVRAASSRRGEPITSIGESTIAGMHKGRLEAFSDGVLAIIITIMVLELKVPHGEDLEALRPLVPLVLSYLLSFVYLGIYWNNHHHLLHATRFVSGSVMWANLHLLFWLSLIPATTAWVGEHPSAAWPTALYGVVLFMAGIAWLVLERAIIRRNGRDSELAQAVGNDRKGQVSALLYATAIGLSFVHWWAAEAVYASVALMWIVPDPRIESKVQAS
jgi:TMEM175 potassium channel family protein